MLTTSISGFAFPDRASLPNLPCSSSDVLYIVIDKADTGYHPYGYNCALEIIIRSQGNILHFIWIKLSIANNYQTKLVTYFKFFEVIGFWTALSRQLRE